MDSLFLIGIAVVWKIRGIMTNQGMKILPRSFMIHEWGKIKKAL